MTTRSSRRFYPSDRTGNCALCGIWRKVLCRDRIIPGREGGKYEPSNIQWICANCHQDKTALEQSAAHKGRKKSLEQRAKMSEKLKGRPVSPETRLKISRSVSKAMREPEVREKMLEGMKHRKGVSPWKGGHLPAGVAEKISATLKAKPPKPKNEPWIDMGISKTTFYRRLRKAENAATV